jgi:serine kinase of HPr protein (carbohydrate metabolism regulator)
MTLAQLVDDLGFEVVTDNINMDRQIQAGYVSDLLSDVIANIQEDSVWITIQRHINILGVAKLKDVVAIVIPRNLQIEESVIEKAREEGIAILRGINTAFEISGLIYNALTRG